jgi:autotransporter-associated beta strand protein
VNGGSVTLNGATGRLGFSTNTIVSTGAINLDNSTNAVNDRLGGAFLLASPSVATAATTARVLNIQGGTLKLTGNGTSAVTENMGTLTVGSGGGVITLIGGAGGATTLNVSTLSALATGGSLLLRGDNLGGVAGPGVTNLAVTTFNVPASQGTGTNGSQTMPIRPDMIADASSTGQGTGFVTRDTGGNNVLRPLTSSELSGTVAGTTTNVGLSAVQSMASPNTQINSLTLNSGGGVTAATALAPNAALNTLTLTTGGVLGFAGNAGINTTELSTLSNAEIIFHTVGSGTTLTVNSFIAGTNGGLVKADAGTLSLAAPQFYTGATTVNGGTLSLAGGNNTLVVIPTATIPTLQNLVVNGGALDLNANSQAIVQLSSINTLPNTGGTITNSAATPVNFISMTGATSTFAGTITNSAGGDLSFYKQGAGAITLTSASSFTGAANIAGGSVTLKDGGAFTAASGININYANLALDNTGLFDGLSRLGSAPITMNGGTLTVTGRQAIETSTQNLGTFTVNQGLANVALQQSGNLGTGAYSLTLANLVHTANSPATLLFTNGTSVTIGLTGANPQVFVSQLNGSAFTASNLTNNIIGGWAIANNGLDFASYTNAAGVGGLSITGFPAYSGTLAAGTATDNVSVTATAQNVTGRTINSLAVRAPGAATTIGLSTPADILNIGTGDLLINDSGNKGVSIQGGQLTAGGGATGPASLYIFTAANTQTIFNQIVNNGSNVVSLVRSGGGTITLTPEIIETTSPTATTSLTVPSASSLIVGMTVTGTGFSGQTITAIAGNVLTLSSAPTAGTNIQTTFVPPAAASTTNGTNTVTTATTAFTPTVGMAVGGTGVPGGTTITAVSGSSGAWTLTLSNPVAAGTPTLTYGALSNTYTGATVNNGGSSIFGTLNLSGLPGSIVIPGDLTVGNAAVTMVTNQGQIAPTSNVTFVSGGALTLVGTNTLNSLTFAGNGTSGGTGTAAVGTLLNLSAANAIASTNNNLSTTPTVSGTALALANATPVITTSGLSPDDLLISAPITSAGGAITKTGTGSLILSGASTFTTGVNLNAGTLIFAANSAGTPPAITSGPIGTGTLTIADGTAIQSGTATQTIGNAVTVNGNFTFSGTGSSNNLTLSGAVALGSNATRTITVSPFVTGTLSGAVTGTGTTGLTKAGMGSLVVSNTGNSWSGATTVNAGLLQLGAAGVIPDGSALVIGSSGAFDLKTFSETVGSLAGSGLVTNSSTAATLTIGFDNTSTTFSGLITAPTPANLILVKTGSGTQTFASAQTYNGGTTINGGTLSFATGGGLVSAVTVNSGSAIATTSTATVNLGNMTLNGNSSTNFALSASEPAVVFNVGTRAGSAPAMFTARNGSPCISDRRSKSSPSRRPDTTKTCRTGRIARLLFSGPVSGSP